MLFALDNKWSEARDAFLKSIDLMELVLGRSHPESIRAHLNLARIYEHRKQWRAASASVATAREITETRLSPDHPVMAEILATSASILRKTGHKREARDLSRRAKAIVAVRAKDSSAESWIHVADLMQPARH